MALTNEDVREILRIIDESELDELRIETDGFSLHVQKRGAGAVERDGDAGVPAQPPAVAPEPGSADELLTIPSPMLGTFYRAEAPGSAPFVDVGATVEPDTIVCIIEVMKMMNSVPSGVTGTVVEVCSGDGELVEYGAPMFRVRP